jgi:hypothetical protein
MNEEQLERYIQDGYVKALEGTLVDIYWLIEAGDDERAQKLIVTVVGNEAVAHPPVGADDNGF